MVEGESTTTYQTEQPNLLDQMVEMFRKGRSYGAIGRALGLDAKSVRQQLADANVPEAGLRTPERVDILTRRVDELEDKLNELGEQLAEAVQLLKRMTSDGS